MNSNQSQRLNKIKILFIGDEKTGKTSIQKALCYQKFEDQYQPTIGIDLCSKNFLIDDKVVRLQLWDTSGVQRFQPQISKYTRQANIIIYVCDVTNKKSISSLRDRFLPLIKKQGSMLVFFAHKCDLSDDRVLDEQECRKQAQKYHFDHYFETSSKYLEDIKQTFLNLTIQYLKNQEPNKSSQIKKQNKNKDKEELIKSFLISFFAKPQQNKNKKEKKNKNAKKEQKNSQKRQVLKEESILLDAHKEKQILNQKNQIIEGAQIQLVDPLDEQEVDEHPLREMNLSRQTLAYLDKHRIDIQILMAMDKNDIKGLRIAIGDQFRIIEALQKK